MTHHEGSTACVDHALDGMTTRKQPWKTIAKRLLGKQAVQSIGDGSGGQFALVTPCRDQINFCLWATREAAENLKSWLDLVGYGGGRGPKTHYIVDLGQSN